MTKLIMVQIYLCGGLSNYDYIEINYGSATYENFNFN